MKDQVDREILCDNIIIWGGTAILIGTVCMMVFVVACAGAKNESVRNAPSQVGAR
jgi:hypothetical protein